MQCPHCGVSIHEAFHQEQLAGGARMGIMPLAGMPEPTSAFWSVKWMTCPACDKAIINLMGRVSARGSPPRDLRARLIHPRTAQRTAAAANVPPDLAEDFDEAGKVLADSPKASAALSRRCLQSLLRQQGYTQKDLAPAIQAVLDAKALPSALAEGLDAVRNIGNFAAHPLKDTNSGAIVPVEPEEAEWNLEILEGLFDFFYVQPAKTKARIEALNAKLSAAGKPPIKQPIASTPPPTTGESHG